MGQGLRLRHGHDRRADHGPHLVRRVPVFRDVRGAHHRRRRSTEQAIWEDVLEQFAAVPGIDFAYSTTRFFDRAGGSRSRLRTKASEESDDAVEQN